MNDWAEQKLGIWQVCHSEVFLQTPFLNMSKVRHDLGFNGNNFAAFLHSASCSMLIHWSPRVAPLVKTGPFLNMAKVSCMSQVSTETTEVLSLVMCAPTGGRMNIILAGALKFCCKRVQSDSFRVVGACWVKWMNVGINLVLVALLLRKQFTIECHLICCIGTLPLILSESIDHNRALEFTHWEQQWQWQWLRQKYGFNQNMDCHHPPHSCRCIHS